MAQACNAHLYRIYTHKYTHTDMQLRERCTITIVELKGVRVHGILKTYQAMYLTKTCEIVNL